MDLTPNDRDAALARLAEDIANESELVHAEQLADDAITEAATLLMTAGSRVIRAGDHTTGNALVDAAKQLITVAPSNVNEPSSSLPADSDETLRRELNAAIGHAPAPVSITGNPGIRLTHRTAEDRDNIVDIVIDWYRRRNNPVSSDD